MADKTYIYGTVEYLDVEVDCTTPGVTFTYSEWGVEFATALTGTAFNAATATWTAGTLVQDSSVDYARILLGSAITPAVGEYKVYLRLTKVSAGTEVPIIKAAGTLKVVAG